MLLKNNSNNLYIEKLKTLIMECLELKETYEKVFKQVNLNDTSFLLLKKEIELAINNPPKNYISKSEIITLISKKLTLKNELINYCNKKKVQLNWNYNLFI